jgi:hypothetical protein
MRSASPEKKFRDILKFLYICPVLRGAFLKFKEAEIIPNTVLCQTQGSMNLIRVMPAEGINVNECHPCIRFIY